MILRSGAPSSRSSQSVVTSDSMSASPSAAADEGADVTAELRPILVAHVHHVAGVIIMELDPVAWDAGPRQGIFGGEEGRGEVVIALADEDPEARIFAQRPANVGRDVDID